MSRPEKEIGPGGNRADSKETALTAKFTARFSVSDTPDIDLSAIGVGSHNPRYEVFLAGWAHGYESRQAEIDRLNFEADYWFFRATNPRLDWHRHATDRLWEAAA